MANPTPTVLEPTPPELTAAIVRDAEADADMAADFLDLFGFRCTAAGDRAVLLPEQFLLGLGAVMRLYRWGSGRRLRPPGRRIADGGRGAHRRGPPPYGATGMRDAGPVRDGAALSGNPHWDNPVRVVGSAGTRATF